VHPCRQAGRPLTGRARPLARQQPPLHATIIMPGPQRRPSSPARPRSSGSGSSSYSQNFPSLGTAAATPAHKEAVKMPRAHKYPRKVRVSVGRLLLGQQRTAQPVLRAQHTLAAALAPPHSSTRMYPTTHRPCRRQATARPRQHRARRAPAPLTRAPPPQRTTPTPGARRRRHSRRTRSASRRSSSSRLSFP
jgi:hypothetical protein